MPGMDGEPGSLRVGWIGLGAIGEPMARRVLQAHGSLLVWNRDAGKSERMAADGAQVAPSPAALARAAHVVCLCVTDTRAVEQVVFGPQGLSDGLAPGTVVVDHSTIHPVATRALAERLAARGGHWVDAPVSGGPAGAREGRLSVFAGGDEAALARVRPVLQAYAARITHLGLAGAGQTGKACNQMVSFGTAGLLAEALHLAHRFGIDAEGLADAMQGGFADSAVLRHYAPAMLEGRYSGSTLNAVKDMDIALDLGRETGTPLPLAGVLASLYRLLVQQGHTDLGMAGVMRLYVDGALAEAPRAGSAAAAEGC